MTKNEQIEALVNRVNDLERATSVLRSELNHLKIRYEKHDHAESFGIKDGMTVSYGRGIVE
jgi:hypothetical protein